MKLGEAFGMAREELDKHRLTHWQIKFNDRRCSFGVCNYHEETIYLSRHLVELNTPERVKNTILHEIAHALLGPGFGHNEEWKKLAVAVGCDGMRCYTKENTITPKLKQYTYVCPNCGAEIRKTYVMRETKRACKKCCEIHNNGVFDNRFVFRLANR